MKLGSYKVIKEKGGCTLGHRDKAIQPYVTWEGIGDSTHNALFFEKYKDAIKNFDQRQLWNEDDRSLI